MPLSLVTGVAGFIGSSLARTLLARGDEVRGLDNLINGKLERLDDLRPGLDLRLSDLNDSDALREACRGVDTIFHHAALPSVPRSIHDPLPSHRNNIDGTFNLLLMAREMGVRRVIYSGSSSAYGDTPTLPKVETMSPKPLSPYALQKLTCELYMQVFHRVYGLETVCFRYFNVFGPWQAADSPYSGVLAKFINNMLDGMAPTIFGDGTQGRDFTYIDNVLDANLRAAAAPAATVAGNVYNIACGRKTTLLEIVQMLGEITDLHEPPVFAEPRAGDVRDSLADLNAAERDLGYVPQIHVREGLERTVAWYRKQRR
jgi:UDP-glucose 4-epimerase